MAGGFWDFSRQRSLEQAVLFYVALVLLGVLIVAAGTALLFPTPEVGESVDFSHGFALDIQNGRKIAPFVNIPLCGVPCLLILRRKNLFNPKGIGCAVLSVALAIVVGSFAGMIPPAYLTTQPAVKGR